MYELGYVWTWCCSVGRIRVVSESNTLYPWPLIYEEAPHVVTYANIIAQERRGSQRHVPASRATGCGIVAVSWGGAPIVRPRGCSHIGEPR